MHNSNPKNYSVNRCFHDFDVVEVICGTEFGIWKSFIKKMKNTRPYLIELMYSKKIEISNLTLIDLPSWFVHPVYSRSVLKFLKTFIF